MFFKDREDAGERLGALLKSHDFGGATVLGIPRGGVVVAARVAEVLRGKLGVAIARKLRAPRNPAFAIGAIAPDGSEYVDAHALRELSVDRRYLDSERNLQLEEAQRREELFEGHRHPPVSGRPVIIVDDGLATSATAFAAMLAMRSAGASQVIVAAPIASPDCAYLLRQEADRVVCLIEDPELCAVGQYYKDFRPVEDEEVQELLEAMSPAAPQYSRPRVNGAFSPSRRP